MSVTSVIARHAAPVALILAYATLVYFPITRTFFHEDDFLHLYDIVTNPPLRFILKMNGGHLLLLPEVVFWVTHALAGPNPAPYMWTELVFHLLNAVLLYAIANALMRRRWLASGCVIAWSTMLLQEGTLNAYTVFEQTLCVFFVLLALLRIVRSMQRPALSWAAASTAGLATIAASCCFGTGLATGAAMPLVALLLVPPSQARRRLVIALVAAMPVALVLYFAVESYNIASFGAAPAMAVAPRDAHSFQRTAALIWHLVAVGTTALSLDGLFRPALYPSPISALALATTAAIVLFGARVAAPAERRALTAMLLLCLAAYAIIAAGRGFIPIPPERVAMWPRYHYTGTAGLSVAVGLALAALARRLEAYARLRHIVFGGWLLCVAVAHQFTPPINNYEPFRRATASAVAAMRAAAEAAPPGTVVQIENHPFGTGNMLPEMRMFFPGWFAVHVVFVGGEQINGRPIRFVEPVENVRAAAQSVPLGARLVISPKQERQQD
ncbi:MAG: hypothetical protein ABI629_08310 [bacterium]